MGVAGFLMIRSLSSFDITAIAPHPYWKVPVQIGFGAACALAMIAMRSAVDMIAPTSGPFALVYPTVLIATLFGHLLAGAVAYVVCFFWAWYFVLGPVGSFTLDDPSDPARVVINGLATLVIIGFAEIFRRAVQSGNATRDEAIARRELLMEELDHRTKNNFMMVSSLLAIQQRESGNPQVAEALEQASSRVHMFAKAYENLSETRGEGYPVEMRDYINDVIERVRLAGFDGQVDFTVSADTGVLPRQTAVSIGIFINEAVTNCSKYAFPDGRAGNIDVSFTMNEEAWRLVVADDGVGSGPDTGSDTTPALALRPDTDGRRNGRGAVLMAALAQQVRAQHTINASAHGTRVEVVHCGTGPAVNLRG